MEPFRKFLQGKGFALVLAACLLAAAAAGVWAVRIVRDELQKELSPLRDSQSVAPALTRALNVLHLMRRTPHGISPPNPPPAPSPTSPKRPRPLALLAGLLGPRLALVRCASPPSCKPNPRLPAVQRLLPPHRPSRAES